MNIFFSFVRLLLRTHSEQRDDEVAASRLRHRAGPDSRSHVRVSNRRVQSVREPSRLEEDPARRRSTDQHHGEHLQAVPRHWPRRSRIRPGSTTLRLRSPNFK